MPLDVFPGTQDAEAYAATRPGFGPGLDVGAGEAFSSAWRAAAGTWRVLRLDSGRQEALQEWIDRFSKEAGWSPANPERLPEKGRRKAYEAITAAYQKFAAENPDTDLPAPPDEVAAHEFALKKERALVAEDEQVRSRPRRFGASIGFAGGDLAGVATDPVNIASMSVGFGPGQIVGGALRQIGSTALREAALGAVSQAAIEAATFESNVQVDPDYGFGAAALQVGTAGAGGLILGAGLKGLAVGWSRVRTGEWPRYVKDAGNVVERQAHVAEQNPYRSAGVEGEAAHAVKFKAAEDAIAAGQPVALEPDMFSANGWRPSRVYDAEGRDVGVKYEVVEADTLTTSHGDDFAVNPDYPVELQPRDRARGVAEEQVANIAARLQPERLGPSVDAGDGAPVIGPDNIVESGNGRVMALRRVYSQGGPQADSYRNFLISQNFDVAGMSKPVLIARRVTDLAPEDRVRFATAANRAGVLRLSAPEQALADARLIDSQALSTLAEGAVGDAGNRNFVRGFLAKLPRAEHGGLVDARGRVSTEGVRRVEAALMARAYGDPALLSRALENVDNNVKSIAGALSDAAGRWAAMRDDVAAGTVPAGMDITGDLLTALRIVTRARDAGVPVASIVNQADIFDAPPTNTRALLGMFFRDADLSKPSSRASIAKALAAYADEARKNTTDARLFGEPLTPDQVLTTALTRAERDDLAALAAEAAESFTPEGAATRMAAPETDDAVLLEFDRLLASKPDLTVPLAAADDLGAETVTARSAKELIAEADAEITAAERIATCAMGVAA